MDQILSDIPCKSENNECSEGICDGQSPNVSLPLNKCQKQKKYNEMARKCNNGKSECIFDVCVNKDKICEEMLGAGSFYGDDQCFKMLNVKGNEFGYCQNNHLNFIGCSEQNAVCGKIICSTRNSIIKPLKYYQESDCVFKYPNFRSLSDINSTTMPRMVPDGTKCGVGKMCYNQECLDSKIVIDTMNEKKCGAYGIVDSNNECFCEYFAQKGSDGFCYLTDMNKTKKMLIAFIFGMWHLYFFISSKIFRILRIYR
ncbi:Disintegrin and metalloproteinase domain-containing protein 7 [Thelohanellus kitauei]|uniref:Disintegrin and metalloproteinase domain-containing protein 7 n=1 Tax=Thelohanellus kitauei TaxID=669202 RepID=A0A0C2MFD3_THEKT|nr:Disintegrin and metalloproteinase domain-containing protein 7 [Thelohanellus kitauei]